MLILFSIFITVLTQIPDEYRELVNEAKRKPKIHFMAEEKQFPARN